MPRVSFGAPSEDLKNSRSELSQLSSLVQGTNPFCVILYCKQPQRSVFQVTSTGVGWVVWRWALGVGCWALGVGRWAWIIRWMPDTKWSKEADERNAEKHVMYLCSIRLKLALQDSDSIPCLGGSLAKSE